MSSRTLRKTSIPFRRGVTVLLLTVIFAAGTATLIGGKYKPLPGYVLQLRYVSIGLSLVLLVLMSRLTLPRFPRHSAPLLISWVFWGFAALCAEFANGGTGLEGLWLILGVPLLFFNMLPRLLWDRANFILALVLILSSVPYIAVSLLLHPVGIAYRGVLGNPNGMGKVCVFTAVGAFTVLAGQISAKRRAGQLLCLLLLIVAVATLLLTVSRTSMIAFAAITGAFLWGLRLRGRTVRSLLLPSFILALFLGLAIWSIQGITSVEEIVLRKAQKEYLLSGRGLIWTQVWEEKTLLGHGPDYFRVLVGYGAHNTLIQVLGRYGMIAAVLLVCFALLSFFYAYGYAKTHVQHDIYSIAPLIICTCFWVLSMAEGMFGKLGSAINLAYFLSVGVVIMSPSKGSVLARSRTLRSR